MCVCVCVCVCVQGEREKRGEGDGGFKNMTYYTIGYFFPTWMAFVALNIEFVKMFFLSCLLVSKLIFAK